MQMVATFCRESGVCDAWTNISGSSAAVIMCVVRLQQSKSGASMTLIEDRRRSVKHVVVTMCIDADMGAAGLFKVVSADCLRRWSQC